MSSVLGLNVKEREEVQLLEKGEHEFEVQNAEARDLDKGKSGRISVICAPKGVKGADPIFHPLWYPSEEDTARQRNNKRQAIEDFIKALGLKVKPNEVDLDEWKGCSFTALVDIESDEEYGDRNVISEVILPR